MHTAHTATRRRAQKVVRLFAVAVVAKKQGEWMDARGTLRTHVLYRTMWEGAMALAPLSLVLVKVHGGSPQGVLCASVSAETSVGVSLEIPN